MSSRLASQTIERVKRSPVLMRTRVFQRSWPRASYALYEVLDGNLVVWHKGVTCGTKRSVMLRRKAATEQLQAALRRVALYHPPEDPDDD